MSRTNLIVNGTEVRHRDALNGTRERSGCRCQHEAALRPAQSEQVTLRLTDLIQLYRTFGCDFFYILIFKYNNKKYVFGVISFHFLLGYCEILHSF